MHGKLLIVEQYSLWSPIVKKNVSINARWLGIDCFVYSTFYQEAAPSCCQANVIDIYIASLLESASYAFIQFVTFLK